MLRPYDINPSESLSGQNIDSLLQRSLDAQQLAAARRVFFSKSWLLIAGDEKMLWGEYKVRSGFVFQPLVQIAEAKFSCTCKAPQPCKHALALLFFARQSSERMQVNHEPPLWVKERLSSKPKVKKEIKTDSATRALSRDARQEKRLLAMQAGLDDLEQWLHDLLGQGLGQTASLNDHEIERMAARLVDAKLSGPARRLRRLKAIMQTEEWTEKALQLFGQLYLFCRAFRRMDSLPEMQARDLLTFGGVNIKKDEVLFRAGKIDHWLVMGVVEGEEDHLRFRRVYLIGEKSRSVALLLDYAWGHQDYSERWVTGMAIDGELVYYPSAFPLRAVFRNFRASRRAYDGPYGYSQFSELIEAQAQLLTKAPLLDRFPALLEDVRPVQKEQIFFLLDKEGKEIPLPLDQLSNWRLLALSASQPIHLFGEWDGNYFWPLSAVSGERLVAL